MKTDKRVQHGPLITGILLASLTASLSFQSYDKKLIHSIELSSASAEIKDLETSAGTFNFKLYKDGDKTIAIPQKTTEGATCTICGNNYTLASDIANIQKIREQLILKIATDTAAKTKDKDRDNFDDESEEQDSKNEIEATKLEAIESKCEKKKSVSQSECLYSGLNKLLKDKKLKFSEKLAFEFFTKKIANKIKSQLQLKSDGSIRAEAYELVQKIISDTPNNYSEIREKAIYLGTESLRETAARLRDKKIFAASVSSDNLMKSQLEMEATYESILFKELLTQFPMTANQGLDSAAYLNNLDSDNKARLLTDLYANNAQRISAVVNDAESKRNYNFVLPPSSEIMSSDSEFVIARKFVDQFVMQQSANQNMNNPSSSRYNGNPGQVPMNQQNGRNNQVQQNGRQNTVQNGQQNNRLFNTGNMPQNGMNNQRGMVPQNGMFPNNNNGFNNGSNNGMYPNSNNGFNNGMYPNNNNGVMPGQSGNRRLNGVSSNQAMPPGMMYPQVNPNNQWGVPPMNRPVPNGSYR